MLKELQAIGLDVQILNEDGEEVVIKELDDDDDIEPGKDDEIRQVMEGNNVLENGADAPEGDADSDSDEEEPTANGGDDDIMSAMSLDAAAEAEHAAADDELDDNE